MNNKTVIIEIGCNEPPIVPKSVNHRCTTPKIKESTKELEVMDIDWSKAPEGATHYNPSSFVELCKYYRLSGNEYVYYYDGHWESSGANKKALDECLIKRPQPPLTYTQAMADNGELPSVGMEVEFDTTFFTTATSNKGTCEIIAYYGGKVWINIIDFDCVINLNVIEFKPLTPPIELIDGKAYQFDFEADINSFDSAIGTYDKTATGVMWVKGKVMLVSQCTNIQQLTVGVK